MTEKSLLAPVHFGWREKLVYYTVWLICWPFVFLGWRTKVRGWQHIKTIQGSAILAPTHRSYVDPAVVGLLTRRPLRPLAKVELFESRLRWLWKYMGACPVRRGEIDRDALRTAGAFLQSGELMIIFPEGTRKDGDQVHDLQGGVGYLAAKNNIPVLPIGVAGTDKALPRHAKFVHLANVKVVVGEPLWPNLELGWRAAADDLTERLSVELQKLYDQARVW